MLLYQISTGGHWKNLDITLGRKQYMHLALLSIGMKLSEYLPS